MDTHRKDQQEIMKKALSMRPDTKNGLIYNSYAQTGDSRPFGISDDSNRPKVKRLKQQTPRDPALTSTVQTPGASVAIPMTLTPSQKDPVMNDKESKKRKRGL
ncbi:hypothetical protein AAF712_015024 [Marasmius tenuissimus]|uniref:Uncharacterized protein n=1 Tax=Marasmius tenuissimus TaxID=585030 RepID=A0ABR2Z9F6_9AGAR